MSARVLHAVTALLWLQGQAGPALTSEVEAVLLSDRRTALRVLRALEAFGVVRAIPGRRPLQWVAVDIDEALDAALAGCRGEP